MYFLCEFCPIWNFSFWNREYHRSIFSVKSGTEEFTHEWSDPLREKVHDSDDLLSDDLVYGVVSRDLRTRLLDPDFSSEVYPDFVRWLPRFRKNFCADDCTDSKFDRFEIFPCDSIVHTVSIVKPIKNPPLTEWIFLKAFLQTILGLYLSETISLR